MPSALVIDDSRVIRKVARSLLEERLAQLMFAAELIGRVSAADETKP